MSQSEARLGLLTRFPPTVCGHTSMRDGARLHTIDPDPKRDVEVYDDGRPWHFTGEELEE